MKKHIILAAVAFLFIHLSSCKKDKTEPSPIEIKFAAEALSYVQLPLNKYFIYKDSATGKLDSVIVTESFLKDIFVPKYDCPSTGGLSWCISSPAYSYQTFSLKLTNYSTSPNQNWYSESATSYIYGSAGGIFIIPSDTAYLSLSGTFIYPYKYYQSTLYTTNAFASVDIEGKTYANVLQFIAITNTTTNDPTYKKSVYYWAKRIGIIKREIRTSNTVKTESLVRHG